MLKSLHTYSIQTIKWLIHYIKPEIKLWSLYTFLKSISGVFGVGIALITKGLIDAATTGDIDGIVTNSIYLATVLIIQLTLSSIRTYMKTRLSQRLRLFHQQRILGLYLKMEWMKMNDYLHGDLMNRISGDIGTLNGIWLSTIPGSISLVVQFITAFITLSLFDYRLALFVFLVSPGAIVASWIIGRYIKPLQKQLLEARSRYKAYLADVLNHIVIIKTFQSEEATYDKFAVYQTDRYAISIKKTKFRIGSNIVITLGYSISFFAVFFWGAYQIALGLLTFGTFTAYLQLISQIQGPMDGMASQLTSLVTATASLDRIIELEKQPEEQQLESNTPHKTNRLDIVFEDVHFDYKVNRPILKAINLNLIQGTRMALIGPSGEGKTTLIRLLLGLVQATDGKLTIGRQTIDATTRNCFSYVPQGDSLFFGTIRENLLIGQPKATDQALYHALELASMKAFIKQLPNGLDSYVGENLVGLSQGQAQRVCIARALLRPSSVLILDEATSSLDAATEREILGNIFEAYPDKTMIVISHKMTILEYVDHIYELKDGRLNEKKKRQI